MASATIKKSCAKCNKGAGTAMCFGCDQGFCTKHFIEHRQELSQQMDNIGQEHDILCKDLTQEQSTHPLIMGINQWEQESITKIQTAAKSARTDLQQLLNKAKHSLKTSVSRMTKELQSSREADDYTELDIKKWTNQLNEVRKMLDNPTTVDLDYENNAQSVIRLIKVSDRQSSISFQEASELHELNSQIYRNLETSVSEKFVDTFGPVILSEGDQIATYVDGSRGLTFVSGIGRYSSGVHYVRFRIEKIGMVYYAFFGIVNLSEKMTKTILDSKSCHGWWDPGIKIVGGKEKIDELTTLIKTGDEVSLILDCDNRRIQLEHHRTHRIVDIRFCAFPWKIIVSLAGQKDCVRILH